MRFLISLACAATLAAGLVGCGGGGGGGGGGVIGAPAALTATVSINGSAATADANGQFAVKPGDTVEITPSQSADWTTSASSEAAVSLRNPSVSGSKWAAQILNGTASAVSYTVSAKASANPSLTKATVLNVSAGDARNGSYRVYAANALQYQLTLDFNANVYTFVNQDGSAPVTDTFNTDSSEPGTYFFKTSRVASVANTSRFRVTTDAVVGNFPFIGPFRHRQYLCGQALHRRSQAGHQPGAVGRHLQPARHPTHGQRGDFADHADGDLVRRHGAKALRRLDYLQHPELPARFGGDLHGQRDGDPGVWGIVNNANPAENGRFAMAFIGDQKVYLSAGAAPSTPGMLVWRLAVQDTPVWAAATGHGGSTKGSWASINMTATGNTRSVINADGTTAAHANTYGGMGAQGPAGMRQFPDGTGSTYFATYNTKLFTIVGASNVTTGGYLQLNLLD